MANLRAQSTAFRLPTICDPTWCGAARRQQPSCPNVRSKSASVSARRCEQKIETCRRIGPALRQLGLLFVGSDVIDGYLTEINVTSPTGIRAIKSLGGPDVAALIWDKIEAKRKTG